VSGAMAKEKFLIGSIIMKCKGRLQEIKKICPLGNFNFLNVDMISQNFSCEPNWFS